MLTQDLKLLLSIFTFFLVMYYGTHRVTMNKYKSFVPSLN